MWQQCCTLYVSPMTTRKFLLVESGILGFRIRNPQLGIHNPRLCWISLHAAKWCRTFRHQLIFRSVKLPDEVSLMLVSWNEQEVITRIRSPSCSCWNLFMRFSKQCLPVGVNAFKPQEWPKSIFSQWYQHIIQKKMLWELIKWSTFGKCSDLQTSSLN